MYNYDRSAAARGGDVHIEEQGSNLVIKGNTYPIYTKLKSKGFHWDGGDRVWWIEKKVMTPQKMKNLKALIDEANGVAPALPGEDEAAQKARHEETLRLKAEEGKRVLEHAKKQPLVGFYFVAYPKGELLKGDTFDLRTELREAGADWWDGEKGWFFAFATVDVPKFERVFAQIEHKSRAYGAHLEKIHHLLHAPRVWSQLGVTLRYDPHTRVVVVSGNTKPVKDTIKSHLSDVRFEDGVWAARALKTRDSELERLIQALDKLEAEVPQQQPEAPKPQPSKRENQRGDDCHRCGEWVAPGHGYLVQDWDDDNDRIKYLVEHKDKTICDKVLEDARIRQQEARTRGDALRNLRNLSMKPEHYVDGDHHLSGREIMLDKTGIAYGGGSWVVIEPDGHHFWFVQNNGADGDDWSRNNVMTGGAGAMGFRLPLTEEAKVLIDVAVGGKSELLEKQASRVVSRYLRDSS